MSKTNTARSLNPASASIATVLAEVESASAEPQTLAELVAQWRAENPAELEPAEAVRKATPSAGDKARGGKRAPKKAPPPVEPDFARLEALRGETDGLELAPSRGTATPEQIAEPCERCGKPISKADRKAFRKATGTPDAEPAYCHPCDTKVASEAALKAASAAAAQRLAEIEAKNGVAQATAERAEAARAAKAARKPATPTERKARPAKRAAKTEKPGAEPKAEKAPASGIGDLVALAVTATEKQRAADRSYRAWSAVRKLAEALAATPGDEALRAKLAAALGKANAG